MKKDVDQIKLHIFNIIFDNHELWKVHKIEPQGSCPMNAYHCANEINFLELGICCAIFQVNKSLFIKGFFLVLGFAIQE